MHSVNIKINSLQCNRKQGEASSKSMKERGDREQSERETQGVSYLVDQEVRSLGLEPLFQAPLVCLHPSPTRVGTGVQKYKR